MAGRKADGARVFRKIVQTQRVDVVDQDAEDAAAVRRIADLHLNLVGHPEGHEPLEPAACRIDHAERGVLRSRDSGCRLDDPLQHAVERELGVDRDTLSGRGFADVLMPRSSGT